MEDKQFEPTACRMLQHTDSLLIKFHLIDKCLQCLCMPITCFSKVNYLSTFFTEYYVSLQLRFIQFLLFYRIPLVELAIDERLVKMGSYTGVFRDFPNTLFSF